MILPYVYKVTHRETGRFYIGFRCANKHPAEQDLGTKYFTSSKTVKTSFSEYQVEIVAVFFDKMSAYLFEQDMIKEHFTNPLIINKHWQKGNGFTMTGTSRPDFAAYNTATKKMAKEVRKYTCPQCGEEFVREEFCHHPVRINPTCSHSCNGKRNAQKRESRKGIPNGRKGQPAWNKGIPNPKSADNGKRGAGKQSIKATGRKRHYNENGSWTWVYPAAVDSTTSVAKLVDHSD